MQNAVLDLAMSFSPNSSARARAAISLPLLPCRSRSPNFTHFSHILHPLRSHALISWRRSSSISVSTSGMFCRRRLQKFTVMAASVPESAGEAVESVDFIDSLRLGAMFGVWYLLNIYYNIFNKQVLKAFPFPTTVTAFQFGCGTVIVTLMWALNFHPRPKINQSQFGTILPLAVAHTMGNILTNVSLGRVAVSFTHTIKAMEPFFTVLLSALFLAERPTFWVVFSLVPVVGGVALASFTEASFNWIGFSSAMASNLTNQSRNIFSKKFMVHKEALDHVNLFSVLTIISFILLVPSALFLEGTKFSPSYLQLAANQGLNVRELCIRLLLSGICFHSYQQVSFSILQEISPVTHAVGNSLKRVVVIVSSVLFFQTAVSPLNALGTGIALMGVFMYSRAKLMMKQKLKSL